VMKITEWNFPARKVPFGDLHHESSRSGRARDGLTIP
jgi:hypothetical protein